MNEFASDEMIVVANRLPVCRAPDSETAEWRISPGGLVSALRRVLDSMTVTWLGWTGEYGAPVEPFENDGIQLRPTSLSRDELDGYYEGFSNRTLWPLYHDAIRPAEYHRHWWRPYMAVNHRFAREVAEILPPDGLVWVHDYHLQLVPGYLRRIRPDARISFFLHIPCPPVELFAQIPWRRAIIRGLLGADRIAFQTHYGAQNFIELALRFADAELCDGGVIHEDRRIEVSAIPIGIDVERFEQLSAKESARAESLRLTLGDDRRVLLGVDRLDYTKGIAIRLRAFEALLERRPELASSVVFIQIAVPSRELLPDYEEIRCEIEQRVGHINGTFGQHGRMPVHYLHRSLPVDELVSYYRLADVMVVTPLRDGMNLVAKEYVATRLDDTGVMILSEFTGASRELDSAVLVNPHDVDGLSQAYEIALEMGDDEARRRMVAMRQAVKANTVFDWAGKCLNLSPQDA